MPAGDGNFQEFIRDRLVWRTEEKLRTRKFFHDLLSSKIMVASFAAHAALEKATQIGAQENGELARVTALLHEVIDAIVHGFDERTEQTETIPKEEAASVWRLAASIQLSDRDKPTSLGG
jgi:predicted RNA-binding Zn ribbon-like protein